MAFHGLPSGLARIDHPPSLAFHQVSLGPPPKQPSVLGSVAGAFGGSDAAKAERWGGGGADERRSTVALISKPDRVAIAFESPKAKGSGPSPPATLEALRVSAGEALRVIERSSQREAIGATSTSSAEEISPPSFGRSVSNLVGFLAEALSHSIAFH